MNTIELCRAWGRDEIKSHSGSTGSICDVKKMDDNRIGAADCGTIVASAVNVTNEQENMTTVAEANLNCKEREALLLKKSEEEALARKHAEEVALCRKKAVKEALLLEEDAGATHEQLSQYHDWGREGGVGDAPGRSYVENYRSRTRVPPVSTDCTLFTDVRCRRLPPPPLAVGTAETETATTTLTAVIVSNAMVHTNEKCTAGRALPPLPPRALPPLPAAGTAKNETYNCFYDRDCRNAELHTKEKCPASRALRPTPPNPPTEGGHSG